MKFTDWERLGGAGQSLLCSYCKEVWGHALPSAARADGRVQAAPGEKAKKMLSNSQLVVLYSCNSD